MDQRALPYRQAVVPETFDGTIRIGVVPIATSVVIGSAGAYSIKQKTSGIVLMTGSNSTATVTLASPLIVKLRLQVMCGSPEAVAIRKAEAEALGHITNTEDITSPIVCTRLLLGDFDSSVPFSVRNAYRNLVISQGLAGTDAFYRSYTISAVTYNLTRGATSLLSSEPLVLTSSTGFVTINGVTYRGAAEVIANSTGSLAGVNVIPIEQYLWGVVPLELGPIAFPEFEAQKAQAVAARTYALAGLGKRANDGFDLLATTADQVYGGFSAEHPTSTAAVNETAGIVVTYNGALISALYSSASGGHTADNEEAFDGAPVAYLRGVPDVHRGSAYDNVPSLDVFKSSNPKQLREDKENAYEFNWSSRHRWTFTWSLAEIREVISAFVGSDVGNVLAINVLERGPSGRVTRIEYVTETGSYFHTKDRIRSSLRFFNASHVQTNLPSTLFFVEPVYVDEETKELTGFRVYGGGFGHGTGMAQTGAVGMAERGLTYEQILTHYYTGVALTTAY
jgi:stage II sporulation protein D